jgi:hypothetical protein
VQDPWSRSDADEELPPLHEVIEAARKQRAGPPIDPRLAAYELVLSLARGELYRATKVSRRALVLSRFEEQNKKIEESATGCATFGEQLLAMHRATHEIRIPRKQREKKGPTNAELLQEYEEAHSQIKRLWSLEGNYQARTKRLLTAFPFLTDERASEAVSSKASRAAAVVVGAPYDLSASRLEARCAVARKQR